MVRSGIVSDPIAPEAVLADLNSSTDGACLLFLGVVRDHNEGRPVSGLDYEVYQGMAEKTLADISSEASHRFGTDRIVVLHRIGELNVGEVSTAIAVATPHRGEAYEASRYIIEELKRRLPIWKREHYLDGQTRWVGGHDPGPESVTAGRGGVGPRPGQGEEGGS
ncbi:MAG: molybdenum cofactor biosynthesis protein MoaE [Gemmatimonadetes bacterium]|nr:molybdenum cofactor biosynthesis protein MoaE [Gemmatimonadota bacterium]